MSQGTSIRHAFDQLFDRCEQEMAGFVKPGSPVPLGTVLSQSEKIFRSLEHWLGELPETKILVQALCKNPRAVRAHGRSAGPWHCAILEFFRMRQVWIAFLDRRPLDRDALYQNFETQVFHSFDRVTIIAPVVNLQGVGLPRAIDCGSFTLRAMTERDFERLIQQDLDGEWQSAWYDRDESQSGHRLFMECMRPRQREWITIDRPLTRPPAPPEEPEAEESEMDEQPLKSLDEALERELPMIEYIQAKLNARRDLALPYQEHPLFLELLTVNLFARKPVYIREAYVTETGSFKDQKRVIRDLKVDEGGYEYFMEPTQQFERSHIPALKEWVQLAEKVLCSKFLRGCPPLFGALEALLHGDMAYQGAYGKRLKAYINGLEDLLGGSQGKEGLGKRVSVLLQPFLTDAGSSYDTVVNCYRIRSYMEHNIHERLKYRLHDELDSGAPQDAKMLERIECLRDLLRQSILCCMALHHAGEWRSSGKFTSWLDGAEESALVIKHMLRVTRPFRGALLMGKITASNV